MPFRARPGKRNSREGGKWLRGMMDGDDLKRVNLLHCKGCGLSVPECNEFGITSILKKDGVETAMCARCMMDEESLLEDEPPAIKDLRDQEEQELLRDGKMEELWEYRRNRRRLRAGIRI